MDIVGCEKASFIDYPDKICTVLFIAGCNFQCPYCHNAHVVAGKGNKITQEEIFSLLRERKKYIDAVCISGGEPTLHKELYSWIDKIKQENFLIKLDTNGTNPKMLQRLIDEQKVDYVAMDLKAPFHKYELVVGKSVNIRDVKESINILINSDIDYEFRTTVCHPLLTKEDILDIAQYIKGNNRYYIQNFRDGDTILGGANQLYPYDIKELEEIKQELEGFFKLFKIRNQV
jgi:pyruvate formate lyase activating enzyme